MIEGGLAHTSADQREQSRQAAAVLAGSMVAAAAAGLLAGVLASTNKTLALPATLVLLLPFLAWRRYALTVIGLAFFALLVEQYRIGVRSGDLTDHVPLFTSLSDGFGLSGVYVNPVEILLAIVLLVLLVRAGQRRAVFPRTPLTLGLAVLVGLVVAGAVHGVAAGGDYKMALWEMRPLVYVGVMYLLATQLPSAIGIVSGFLWAFVVAIAIKTVQGLVLVVTAVAGGHDFGDYLLSHEDSLFFVLFFVLVAALWLFHLPGTLRRLSTMLLPLVIVVDLANNRRTSWLQLGACFLVLLLLAWIRLPDRRRFAAGVLVVVSIATAVYLPLYWDHTGLLAQPARAIQSTFSPSVRDASSDLYRQVENANLQINLKRSPLVGVGYGIPIDYVIPIVDLSRIDPFIKFIPHNNVLYIWMRLGAIGALAFWSVIGFAVISACRLLRARDLRLALYGAFVVCALINYLILGYLDLGLFWFRVAIFMGCLLGVLEVARRVQEAQEAQEQTFALGDQPSAASLPARHPSRLKAALDRAVEVAVDTGARGSTRKELSDDGNWWWNGRRWVSATTADSLWRWDGDSWQATASLRDKAPAGVAASLLQLAEDRYLRAGAVLVERTSDWQPETEVKQAIGQAQKLIARLRQIEKTVHANGSGADRAGRGPADVAHRQLEADRRSLSGKHRMLLLRVARSVSQPTTKDADDQLDVAHALEEHAVLLNAVLAGLAKAELVHADTVVSAETALEAAERARLDAINRARDAVHTARSRRRPAPAETLARLRAARDLDRDEHLSEFGGLRLFFRRLETPAGVLPVSGLKVYVGTARELWHKHREPLADLVSLESPEALRFLTALTKEDDGAFLLLTGSAGSAIVACPQQPSGDVRQFAELIRQQARQAEIAKRSWDGWLKEVEHDLEVVIRHRSTIEAAEAELVRVEGDPELRRAIDDARERLQRNKRETPTVLLARRRLEEVMRPLVQAPEPLTSPKA
jgi:hypothetical protein